MGTQTKAQTTSTVETVPQIVPVIGTDGKPSKVTVRFTWSASIMERITDDAALQAGLRLSDMRGVVAWLKSISGDTFSLTFDGAEKVSAHLLEGISRKAHSYAAKSLREWHIRKAGKSYMARR